MDPVRAPVATLSAPPTLGNGRFVVEAHLGEGGQAAVFRVRDLRLGVQRALKVLLPKYVAKPRVRSRFADEARTMAVLEHPNIVRVYDVDNGSTPYLVMELVPSGSLADWLDAYRRFPPRQAVEVIRQVCLGAAAAHAAKVIHRDLKPQNVLVGTDGTCKITDFGIARTEESHRTRVGAALGTEGYMAPEQSRDARTVDGRADVYSIGVTLFVLITGTDPVEWLSGRGRGALPPALRPIVERATALQVAQRYPDAVTLLADLDQVLEQLPPDPVRLPLEGGRPRRAPEPNGPEEWPELAALLDGAPTPVGPAPAESSRPTRTASRPSYSMSRPLATHPASTPAWVEPGPRHGPATGFVVELEEHERRSSRVARSRRSAHGTTATGIDPEAAGKTVDLNDLGDGVGFAGQLVGAGLRAIASPFRLASTLVGIVVVLVALGWLGSGRGGDVPSDRVARAGLDQALTDEQEVVDDLAAIGADRSSLEGMYLTWKAAPEPARTEAALRLVDEVDRVSELLAQPGSATWEDAHGRVRRLRIARDGYRRSLLDASR